MFSFFLGNLISRKWVAVYYGSICLLFQGTAKLFAKWLYHLTFLWATKESFICSTSSPTHSMVSLFNFNYSHKCVVVFNCGIKWYFSKWLTMLNIFSYSCLSSANLLKSLNICFKIFDRKKLKNLKYIHPLAASFFAL